MFEDSSSTTMVVLLSGRTRGRLGRGLLGGGVFIERKALRNFSRQTVYNNAAEEKLLEGGLKCERWWRDFGRAGFS